MSEKEKQSTNTDVLLDVNTVGIHFKRTVSSRRKDLHNSFSSIFRLILNKERKEKFWAVRDVDFELHKGEVIGIIGHNGAGKSTLLKILAGVLIPDEGHVIGHGRISSLLALGSGFMLDLNGRENIYLNGMYMGMEKKGVDEVYEDIVAFSELEKFIETPIKYYSLGMRTRLGFSVAVHTKPEILLIDEVLGAGDKQFQAKARKRMEEVLTKAKGIVIVSHNMDQIANFCTKCIWLEKGKVKTFGPAQHIVEQYAKS